MSRAEEAAVVIVGAGISGLTCLWRLRQAGVDAICLEESERVGGALSSRRADGFLVEAGATTVLETPELVRLAEEAGLEGEIVRSERGLPRFILRHGVLHPLPRGLVPLLRTGLLSKRGKLRLLAERWAPRRAEAGDDSVASFVRRRFGAEAVEAFVAPFVAGTFGGVPEGLGARAVLPALVELEDRFGGVMLGLLRSAGTRGPSALRTLVSFRDGLESLPRQLSERLGERIRLGTAVEAIGREPTGGDWLWLKTRRRGDITTVRTRAVIVAVPACVAARLVDALAPGAASALAELESVPLATVSVAWPRADVRHSLRGLGFLVSPGERVRILGCLWPSSLLPGRAPEGWASFTAFVGGARDPEGASLGDDRLVETVRADLGNTLDITGPPRVLSIDRYPRALPQYAPGHAQRVENARAAIASAPGLFLAGNYLGGVSVGECVRQASEVAAAVAEQVN